MSDPLSLPFTGRVVRDGIQLSFSVDNFLDKHAANLEIQAAGRMAIAKRVLLAERGSSLKIDEGNFYNTINFQNVSNTWLTSLFRILQADVRVENVGRIFEHLRIISFNYDRCVEHFLFHALQRNYGIRADQAAEVMAKLDMVHVYGSLGELPWQPLPRTPIVFGQESAPIDQIAARLKIYTDEFADTVALERIRHRMLAADLILFLGFGYHAQNLELLTPADPMLKAQQVFGTAFKVSEYNRKAIVREIEGRGGTKIRGVIELQDVTCDDLINRYSRALM